MKNQNKVIHRKRKLAGGGLVREIVMKTAQGPILVQQHQQGVRQSHYIPLFSNDAHKLVNKPSANSAMLKHFNHSNQNVQTYSNPSNMVENMIAHAPSSKMDIFKEISKSFGTQLIASKNKHLANSTSLKKKRGGSIRRLF
jgi:hypothetical protein